MRSVKKPRGAPRRFFRAFLISLAFYCCFSIVRWTTASKTAGQDFNLELLLQCSVSLCSSGCSTAANDSAPSFFVKVRSPTQAGVPQRLHSPETLVVVTFAAVSVRSNPALETFLREASRAGARVTVHGASFRKVAAIWWLWLCDPGTQHRISVSGLRPLHHMLFPALQQAAPLLWTNWTLHDGCDVLASVMLLHVEQESCIRNATTDAIVMFFPPGSSYRLQEKCALERRVLSVRPKIKLMWFRSVELWSASRKEIETLIVQIGVRSYVLQRKNNVLPPFVPTVPSTKVNVAVLAQRSMYDPDFVVLQGVTSSFHSESGGQKLLLQFPQDPLWVWNATGSRCYSNDLSVACPFAPSSTIQSLRRTFEDTFWNKNSPTTSLPQLISPVERKKWKVLSDTSRIRIAYREENKLSMIDVEVHATLLGGTSTTRCTTWQYFHYPWVLDNIFHQHNDNIYPLLLSIMQAENITMPQTVYDTRHRRVLNLLPTNRKARPLPTFMLILSLLFGRIEHLAPALSNNSTEHFEGNCLIWGRPRRPFAASLLDALPYILVVRTLSEIFNMEHSTNDMSDAVQNSTLIVTWITRTKERVLLNSDELLNEVQHSTVNPLPTCGPPGASHIVEIRKCCEGLTYDQQRALIRSTDILIGVHGAGLFHITNLDPLRSPLVVHIGSLALDYHEQTIIERLAWFRGIRYFPTHIAQDASQSRASNWREDFQLPSSDVRAIWQHALWTYFCK